MRNRQPTTLSLVEWAHYYAQLGFYVLPLHWVENGSCSCDKPTCKAKGKHPLGTLAPQGYKEATTNYNIIQKWWKLFPKANIGIATGVLSNLLVLDIDPRSNGLDNFATCEMRLGKIPFTPCVETGGGGYHFYFQNLWNDFPSQSHMIFNDIAEKLIVEEGKTGIDIKASGGYVVAPPSIHASGKRYEWDVSFNLSNTSLAQPPGWFRQNKSSAGKLHDIEANILNPLFVIKQGSRTNHIKAVVGHLFRRYVATDLVRGLVHGFNQMYCRPPMPYSDVNSIVDSIHDMEMKRRNR